jgi:hypothetical protein
MNNRPSLGFGDDEDKAAPAAAVLDLSDFQPRAVARPDKAQTAQAAEKANFKSREAKTPPAPVVRASRQRRTGRSSQLNLKVRPDTIEAFYAIADAQGWVLGEAFEKAVSLLEKEYSLGKPT